MKAKTVLLLAVLLVTLTVVTACGGGSSAPSNTATADVGSYWKMAFSDGRTPYSSITQTGTTFSGQEMCDVSENGPTTYSGSINGNTVSYSVTYNSQTVATCTGTVNGTNIQQGTCTVSSGTFTWTGSILAQPPTSKECVIASVDVYAYQPSFLQSHLYDPNGLVQSAALAGTYLSSSQSFSLNYISNPVYVNRWWTPSINIGTTTPAFPMNYTVTINFKDATSQNVARTVTSF